MAIAGLFWVAVLVYLLHFDGVPWRLPVAALFFIVLFGGAVAYYGRTAIFVDHRGVTYRGLLRTRRLSFSEIRNLEVLPGLVTVYAVCAPAARMIFTSLFAHHRQLADLLVERSGLGIEHA